MSPLKINGKALKKSWVLTTIWICFGYIVVLSQIFIGSMCQNAKNNDSLRTEAMKVHKLCYSGSLLQQ